MVYVHRGTEEGAGVAGDGARHQGKAGKTLGPHDSTPELLSARTDQCSRVSQSPSDTPTHPALTLPRDHSTQGFLQEWWTGKGQTVGHRKDTWTAPRASQSPIYGLWDTRKVAG